jgi:hypothetical protein
MSRIVAAVSVMVFAPLGSVASAQTRTTTGVPCAIALGPLTTQQQSLVNDYEIQVAKANSKHTTIPTMPQQVFLLIGCISPASQTGGQTATTTASTNTNTNTNATTTTTTPPAAPTPTPPTSTSSTVTFTCPPNGLSKDQLSQINDYEILVARANSKHTEVPKPSPEVAAYLTCQ